MKICTKCGNQKNESNFSRIKRGKEDLRNWCRECCKTYRKERIRKFNENGYLKIDKKVCGKCKTEKSVTEFGSWKNSPDSFRNWCKRCCKKERDDNRERELLLSYKTRDKRKGWICDLDVKWIKENISNHSCVFCGSTENIGCDRIDNLKGHTKENCQPCCSDCNRTRGDEFSVEEMKIIGQSIKTIRRLRKLNG